MTTEASITNAERAERARKALEAYNDEYDLTTNIVDLLADLQHYCPIAQARGIEHRTFDAILELARTHYAAEINGEE
jgi:hypothetical protein